MAIDETHAKAASKTICQTSDVSRRSLLRGATLAAGGAVFVAATMTAQRADAKMMPMAAAYQSAPKDGQRCEDCGLFVAPSSCKLVDGMISPTGYCRFFVRKS